MRPSYPAAFALIAAMPFRDALGSVPSHPIRPQSRTWFTGASNIRHFTCKARQLTGSLELRGIVTARTVLTGENASVQPSVSVGVDKLDCGIGSLYLHGTYVIRLSDFGVVPPRRFGGLLRVRNSVTVHFDVALDPSDDVVDDIACRLIESANAVNAKEGVYASHS